MTWTGRPFSFDPLEFDGTLFEALDEYRAGLLADIDDLRRRASATRAFGSMLTGDIIAQGRAIVLHQLDVRNDSPLYPPLFLTYLQNRDWINPTDHALCRMAAALESTPKTYREFVRYAQRQPMGGLFELNVYSALDLVFRGAIPQPRLPASRKRSDVLCTVDGAQAYVEAAVIGEAEHFKRQQEQMRVRGQKTWVGVGLGPAHDARRVVSKIAGELAQTTPTATNILCLSFFDWDPFPPAREWAIEDAWRGAPQYGQRRDGTWLDFSSINRIDSIFEFGRDRLMRVHVNPTPLATCRLEHEQRERIQAALSVGRLMIR